MIIQNPNNILRQKTQKIEKITPEIKKIISEMWQELKKTAVGLALAAPQIGAPKAVIVMEYKVKNEKTGKLEVIIPKMVFINPKIIKSSAEKNVEEEGCLSFMANEEIRGEVERAKKIVVKALDEKGKTIRIRAQGFLARVLQHEIDHLNGVLFVDRADPSTVYRVEDEKKNVNL